VVRGRERSLPPPRSRGELVAREREEFVVRRREPSPPSPKREVVKDEIIIRRREERSPSPAPLPPPPPPPQPEIRPPIIQEIITHHRHIDHGKLRTQRFGRSEAHWSIGVERARSPTPPPPPPSPPRDESLEISIRHRECVSLVFRKVHALTAIGAAEAAGMIGMRTLCLSARGPRGDLVTWNCPPRVLGL
jgi:hypothetical protein